MRNPSLHIGKADFITVLTKLGVPGAAGFAERVFDAAVPYHIKNRYLVSGNEDTQRRANKVINNVNRSAYTAERLNGLLTSLRHEKGARFIQKLHKGTREWEMLREILTMATEFVELFKFEQQEQGYKKYLEIGIKLMGKKYALNKFKYYNTPIHEAYEAEKVLEEDATPEDTIKFWECWKAAMLEYAGVELDILTPDKMKHVIYGKQEADEHQANYKDWVVAQFEMLAFLNSMPELSQFYGPNALNRWERYMVDKKSEGHKKTETRKAKTEEPYNLPDGLSSEQELYFAALRKKTG